MGMISTHTPHVGCDLFQPSYRVIFCYFNSHTPCGVRLLTLLFHMVLFYFNSHTPCGVRPNTWRNTTNSGQFQLTHPMWGATFYADRSDLGIGFQLTHPMWGATTGVPKGFSDLFDFNSHTPCGVRHFAFVAFYPAL